MPEFLLSPKRKLSIDRNLVQAMYLSGLKTEVICQQVGMNPSTLKTWINRFGWNKQVAQAKQAAELRYTQLESRSVNVRSGLAEDLVNSVQAVVKMPLTSSPKAYASLQARAQLLEPLARTAKAVFGWDKDQPQGLIVVGDMSKAIAAQEQPAIDVQSSTVPEPADCQSAVIDTTKPEPQ